MGDHSSSLPYLVKNIYECTKSRVIRNLQITKLNSMVARRAKSRNGE